MDKEPVPSPSVPPSRGNAVTSWLWDWAKSIGIALVVWLFLRTFLVEAFHIPSGSMEKTLLVGDWLFVNKALYGAEVPFIHKHLPVVREPRVGDIVVFDSRDAPEVGEFAGIKVVKRLIGMPGDTLAMRGGQLYRNGQAVPEPYVQHINLQESAPPNMRDYMRRWQLPHVVGPDTAGYHPDVQDWGPILVPRDSLFVMGDNRENSLDSRYWGFLPRENLRGSPMFIYFSYDAESYRAMPFLTAVRWGRIFSGVR